MTIDEIMARLTPQEQQHVSRENVAAVLRVLAASIADTAGAKPVAEVKAAYVDWHLVERMRTGEEIDSEEAGMIGAMMDSQADEILSLRARLAAPPAPSVVDVPAMTNEQINHKPGCDALGGYGHGVGPCTCKDAAGPSDEQIDQLANEHFTQGNNLTRHQWQAFARAVLAAGV